ncbi:nucleotide-binding universal stress UspA family protein [Tumebacillus sp. BK434]|uniref:universal stress protein n=1 Tax=Tumebacillus sp. BK434 TaxID=2512169 RepID=UPI0010DF9D63|nr:universal stress protein [Tumebacillus sp. BK434]TCP59311.1 nucleotide-binding universal stress UspA family protein [Tumebacillus sp. BK434]
MYKNILVAVDGSKASDKALQWAKEMHDALPEAKITFLYAHQPLAASVVAAYAPVGYQFDYDLNAGDSANPEITPATRAVEQFPHQERVAHLTKLGVPSDVILKEAEAGGYDLLVLGAEGHGVVESVLLGSVSAKVLHYAKLPVLIVR